MGAKAAGVFVLATLITGCGDTSTDSGDGGASKPAKESASPQTARISKSDVPKGEWPLTVSEGVVRCEGNSGAGSVTFRTPDGTNYGVNGTAKTRGLPGIEPIWKKDPDIPGTRVNISPVLDRGLRLCK